MAARKKRSPKPSAPAATEPAESPQTANSAPPTEAELRAQISQELALERFQAERPDLWLQVLRIQRLMELQETCDEQVFPEGSCFIHVALPGADTFAVRQVLEVDLDTCQVTLDIYGDNDLHEGTVILPLEVLAWFGFPKDAIPLAFPFQGFTTRTSKNSP